MIEIKPDLNKNNEQLINRYSATYRSSYLLFQLFNMRLIWLYPLFVINHLLFAFTIR